MPQTLLVAGPVIWRLLVSLLANSLVIKNFVVVISVVNSLVQTCQLAIKFVRIGVSCMIGFIAESTRGHNQ